MKKEIHLARRYLFRGKARHISFISFVSCLGVMLGIAALIIAFSLINGVDGGLLQRIMKFKDHLTVDSLNKEDLPDIKSRLNRWPEVEAAYFSLQTQVFGKFGDVIMPLVVRGVDFSDEEEKGLFYQYVQRDFGGEGFFVGQTLRRKFALKDTLEFYPLAKRPRLKEERIRGSFNIGLYEVDNYYIIADLETAKSLSPYYTLNVGVKIVEPFDASRVAKKIRGKFGDEIFVQTWIDSNRAIFSALKLQKVGMFIVLGLIVVVASFNIFATLTVKVVEKTKDIGILKTIGFTNKSILTIFSLQGLILGIIGVIGGACLGIGACFLLEKYPFIRVPAEIFGTEYLPIEVNYGEVVFIVAAGLVISFISGLLPARRAAGMPPCEALRYE